MNVLASATFDGENHLLTNQSHLEFAAVDVRTRASSSATSASSILYLPSLTSALFTEAHKRRSVLSSSA
jgi:hypothetical protein